MNRAAKHPLIHARFRCFWRCCLCSVIVCLVGVLERN
jgi:hypothetical protein